MNNRAIANLTLQLQKSLDSNYDVVDMQTVLFVIQQLENTTITKEQLETTRLAKYINELRRRTSSETLARRAKNLLKKWRDSFMPTFQQLPPPQTAPYAAGSANNPVLCTPPLVAASNHNQSQQQQPQHAIVANNLSMNSSHTTNKISTGSANNNNSNTSSKNNSNLSNGGFYQQQTVVGSQQRVDMLKTRGTRVISPMVSGAAGMSGDRKQQQPTSFANVLSKSQMPAALPVQPSTGYNYCRSESPLPNITAATASTQQATHSRHHRQSPVSLLDDDSNHSRPQQVATSSSMVRAGLLNGENNLFGVSNTSGVAGDLHDSNSVSLGLGAGVGGAAGVMDEPLGVVQKVYSTPPVNAAIADICSSSSSHRKSKKHKKDKKRNKQSPDKPPPTSELATQLKSHANSQGAASFLNQYVGEFRPMGGGDDELHNTTISGTVFPPHDSLSSSSMSRFPSNISTNTMTMQNSSPLVVSHNDIGGQSAPSDSDLTFAGKFKNSNNTGFSSIIADNATHSAMKKTYSDSSDVVVVESRSCSPFTTGQMGPEDSCSSSSRATLATETLQLNADSNPEAIIASKSIQSQQRLQQPQTGQQDHGMNSKSVTGTVNIPCDESSSTVVTEQQNAETATTIAPKKRGRKKGSRGFDAVIAQTHALLNVSMFERPRLLLGSKKVKTTKELLADIQSRKLGSSATSSPTLAASRQSVSPSTCSEASFQSDLTNTRVSLLNTRSSPELVGTLTNYRQSDIDDVNSTTDSNDAKPPPSLDRKIGDINKAGPFLSSVDEYLHNLMKQLPPINYSKLNQIDSDFVCTCTVRAVELVVESPKKEVVIIKSEDEEDHLVRAGGDGSNSKTHLVKGDIQSDSSLSVLNAATIGSIPSMIAETCSTVKKSPKKPVKSIFDLDYDEDNDPLHSFVEAAKLRLSQKAADVEGAVLSRQQTGSDGHNATSEAGGNFIAVNSIGKSDHIISSSSPVISIVAPFSAVANAVSLPAPPVPQSTFLDGSMPPDLAPPSFPQYEVVEDPNCAAKNRYEIQTNCITKHHIDILHNCYVKNVNGNWNAPVPMSAEHRKRLRRYYLKTKGTSATSTVTTINGNDVIENNTSGKSSSSWVTDEKFLEAIQFGGSSSGDEALYERVVPQYDHIIMDRVVKDLSEVKFTPNYMRKKLRRLKREKERTAASSSVKSETNLCNNKQNSVSESMTTGKRKRSRTLSGKDTTDCNSDEDGVGAANGEKHKHQRRKKHSKVRETNLETSTNVDINLSRNKVKCAAIRPAEEGVDNGEGRGDRNNQIFTSDNHKPNRFSDTDNACDVDISQTPVTTLHGSPKSEERLTTDLENIHDLHNQRQIQMNPHALVHDEAKRRKLGLDWDLDLNPDLGMGRVNKTDDDDHHVHKKDTVDVTLIESSSNSSNSCTSNINNNSGDKIKENNQLVMTSMLNEDAGEGSNSHDYSYYSGDGDTDMIDADGGMDDDADEDADDDEYDDEDEDYDEDDHNNDEEHEVVTHDMTSSTSTTSQQHIVLTIKKKISKSASSHGKSVGNDTGKVSPLRLTAATINLEDKRDKNEEQLSIITSSETPTTIKIRRKNHHQQKANQSTKEQESQQSRHTISDIDYGDNNNIKIAINPILHSEDGGNRKIDEAKETSDSTILDKESIEASEFVHGQVEPTQKSVNCGSTVKPSTDNHTSLLIQQAELGDEGTCEVKMEHVDRQSPIFPSADDIKQETMPLQLDREENCNKDQKQVQTARSDVASDTDDDNEGDWQSLPKENNGLLPSFNELNDDNYLGLRVIPKTCDPPNTSPLFDTLSVTTGRTTHNTATDTTLVSPPSCKDMDAQGQQQYQVQDFKEWHEVLQVPSYNDELLTILPYVVID